MSEQTVPAEIYQRHEREWATMRDAVEKAPPAATPPRQTKQMSAHSAERISAAR